MGAGDEQPEDGSDGENEARDRAYDPTNEDEQRRAAEQLTSKRDQAAADRDRAATLRDRAASHRDAAQAEVDLEMPNRGGSAAEQRTADRGLAAADRSFAAADREEATADRSAAARDREAARAELRQAQFDGLTGAFGRELGMVVLEREINRARHGNGRLVLTYIDVDGLKQTNDLHGHAAGDGLLRAVVAAIRTHLRSYDPIVRVGGDEFICMLADITPDDGRHRFQSIRATIEESHPTASISVGFAALRPQDTLEQLTERGDAALYEAKQAR